MKKRITLGQTHCKGRSLERTEILIDGIRVGTFWADGEIYFWTDKINIESLMNKELIRIELK